MKNLGIAFGAAAIWLLSSTSGAEAVCSKKYFTGDDIDPIWWQGRDYARSNWSEKVADVKGVKWSKWSKSRNKDESCDWLPTRGVNYCVARAQPCK
jgi:hypothetical protein